LKETIANSNEESVAKRKHNSNLVTPTSQKRTPVIGILTEPLRGALRKGDLEIQGLDEYIPLAHVKFLE
jgi:hypothetical protein